MRQEFSDCFFSNEYYNCCLVVGAVLHLYHTVSSTRISQIGKLRLGKMNCPKLRRARIQTSLAPGAMFSTSMFPGCPDAEGPPLLEPSALTPFGPLPLTRGNTAPTPPLAMKQDIWFQSWRLCGENKAEGWRFEAIFGLVRNMLLPKRIKKRDCWSLCRMWGARGSVYKREIERYAH